MGGVAMAFPEHARILDACVLIDYCLEDAFLLGLASRALGPIVVLTPILGEVRQLEERTCEQLGLWMVEPETSLAREASVRRGGLSFRDRLCLAFAKAHQAILYSNDRRLLNVARSEGADARWGLELLLELVEAYALTPEDALQAAGNICRRSIYPAEPLIDEFKRRLRH